jgi:hypothetical protein
MDKRDSEETVGEGLLTPLCRLYGALAVTDDIHNRNSNQKMLNKSHPQLGFDPSWNLQGSLLTAGLNPSTFPRFKMFARLTRLIIIEMKDGRSARDALDYALRAVLPFYTLTPMDIATIEVNINRTFIHAYIDVYVNMFLHKCIWIYTNLFVCTRNCIYTNVDIRMFLHT